MADVSVTWHDRVAVLEIGRPPANYLDLALVREIADICADLPGQDRCRAVVLCSRGKHFCAGADFGSADLQADRDRLAGQIYEQGLRLFSVGVPVVAAVQGVAAGAGLGLACAADFRVASATTRFHANFATLGFHHGFGLSVTLPRIVGRQFAAEMLLAATRVEGEQAAARGLADRCVPAGQEREGALALAGVLARQAPLAVSAMRRTLRAGLAREVETALAHELGEQRRLWATEDSRVGIAAGLARTRPEFTGR